MNEAEDNFMIPYMMGRTSFNAAFDNSLSSSKRVEQLDQAAYYFEEALKSAPDIESQMDCHRLLGAVLFTQNFHLRNMNILDLSTGQKLAKPLKRKPFQQAVLIA